MSKRDHEAERPELRRPRSQRRHLRPQSGEIDAAAEELRALGATVCAVAVDVRDIDALEAAFAVSEAELGAIDVLVCGAAGNFLVPADKLSANGFRTVIEIDLLGSFNALIVPGPIEGTEGAKRLTSPEAHAEFVETVPLRRMGTVDDIGQTAVFLASPLAAYITGCVVVCDGGQNLPGSAPFNAGAERVLQAQPGNRARSSNP